MYPYSCQQSHRWCTPPTQHPEQVNVGMVETGCSTHLRLQHNVLGRICLVAFFDPSLMYDFGNARVGQ